MPDKSQDSISEWPFQGITHQMFWRMTTRHLNFTVSLNETTGSRICGKLNFTQNVRWNLIISSSWNTDLRHEAGTRSKKSSLSTSQRGITVSALGLRCVNPLLKLKMHFCEWNDAGNKVERAVEISHMAPWVILHPAVNSQMSRRRAKHHKAFTVRVQMLVIQSKGSLLLCQGSRVQLVGTVSRDLLTHNSC